jgi:opacity protein-like surface antigen
MKPGIIAAATLLALASGTALAQGPENESGLYVGAGFGQFNVGVDDVDDTDEAISRIDDDDHAWKIFAGWRINPYVSVELNYVDFGENSGSTGSSASGSSGNYSVDLAGFQPAVYGTIPLGPVELFGKVGYYFYDVDLSVNLDNIHQDNFSADTSEEAFSYGAGIGATFFEHLNARLEYEKIDADFFDDLDSIWLTGAWRF